EQLLLRLRSSDLAEARFVGNSLLSELREVIPSFLTRVDRPDRGEVWSEYLAQTRSQTRALAAELLAAAQVGRSARGSGAGADVQLVAWSEDADVELLTGMLYPHSTLPEAELRAVVEGLSAEQRRRVVEAYVGNRR